jgi:hypothetical protein
VNATPCGLGVRRLAVLLSVAFSTGGCASELEVTDRLRPDLAARAVDARLRAVAVVRADDDPKGMRVALGSGAVLTPEAVLAESPTALVVASGDRVVLNEQDQVIEVRTSTGELRAQYEPGRATLQGDQVHVAGQEPKVIHRFAPGDRVEVTGTYRVGETVPTGGRIETTMSAPFIAVGASALGVGYVPSLLIGVTSAREADRALLVPVFGPFLDLALRGKCVPPPADAPTDVPGFEGGLDPCGVEDVNRAALIAAGVTQLVGAVFLGFGLLPRPAYVRDLHLTAGVAPSRQGGVGSSVGLAGSF